MKEALVSKGPKVEITNTPIPSLPSPNHILIRVVVTGTNPKDWKLPDLFDQDARTNQGDDIAGIVHTVGANVYEFKPGDRVAAFHEMRTPHGSYAEYAIAWQHTTFHIPHNISFEEAAALPLAAMTSAIGLYNRLRLSQPWSPEVSQDKVTDIPLLIYGASSAVGIYGLQFALRSNIHPLICVAGSSKDYVASFIDPSKGDVVVDYRDGPEATVDGIKKALGGRELRHVLDAVSLQESIDNIAKVLSTDGGHVTFVLGGEKKGLREGQEHSITMVGDVHNAHKDFGYVYFRYIARGLEEGWFKPQRVEVVSGGLGGVQKALEDLKKGKASGVKYVMRIEETEGLVKGDR
ncbi:chaperonin 10-like protein [Apiosordaria backusii]|uniref:Chaperonin 10-like protein n=1 Tax=Apiosordaria backusii TaxID=314023 RepID=A0AA40AES5_9PEZI|nr:chaperonin 10-like protein [Apiosordaria backusii]